MSPREEVEMKYKRSRANLLLVIIDILFHTWVMFYLITGVINGFKLKRCPRTSLCPSSVRS